MVSMRTLLASDKFQVNNYNLPIAIGKKIDNENFIVDLASMPHLLMAGATGQGGLLLKGHGHHLAWAFVSGRRAGRFAATLEKGA